MLQDIICSSKLHYIGKVLLLALLYYVTGKFGLLLAVPPGYATVIWPPSGIALGMLMLYGWRLWPGILAGSFFLNSYISGAYSHETGLIFDKILIAFCIATGSTLQALTGRWLIARYVGLPLKLSHVREVFRLLVLAGPVACLIAASVGVSAMYVFGVLAQEGVVGNWLAWWTGDVFGVLVFLPLVLVAPGSPSRPVWRGNVLGELPIVVILMLTMLLGLTFYAWKIASETAYEKSQSKFQFLVEESKKAFLYRLGSYENVLLGCDGFFQGSDYVSHSEWRHYIEALNIKKNFPGISGIGYIAPVKKEDIEAYQQEMSRREGIDFKVHPKVEDKPYDVIQYVEPEGENQPMLGLNIAFEANRLDAAEKARNSGKSVITKQIRLLQRERKTSGFLLLHPMYQQLSSGVVDERHASFRGWIYASFVAESFLQNLTQSQGLLINLRIYEGDKESADALIYSSDTLEQPPKFVMRQSLNVMQQKWLLVWESTSLFEQANDTINPMLILVAGLLFTGMFGSFLMVLSIRRLETLEVLGDKASYVLPAVIFIVMVTGTYILYVTLQEKEQSYVRGLVQDEGNKIDLLLTSATEYKLAALRRMAQRWEVAEGTPYWIWRNDALNYVHDLKGLRAVEWVDSTYHVRWAIPVEGNERAIGLNIVFDKKRQQALEGAAEKKALTLTPPLDLVQGYRAFIAYFPLIVKGKFDGFIVGIFSVDDFFGSSITKEISDHFDLSMRFEGKEYFTFRKNEVFDKEYPAVKKILHIYDKKWVLNLIPTKRFVESEQTLLPFIVLVAGILIAALSALTVRFVFISMLRAKYLEISTKALQVSDSLKSAVLSSTQYLVIATDKNGLVTVFNDAAEKALGYSAQEVIGHHTPTLWHDPEETAVRAHALSDELGGYVQPGFQTFVRKAELYMKDESEWIFVRKDKTRFPVSLSVSILKDDQHTITGYVGVIQDITRRKEAEAQLLQYTRALEQSNQELDEFAYVASHDLKAPLRVIDNASKWLEEDLDPYLDEDSRENLQLLRGRVQRMEKLLDDLLEYSCIGRKMDERYGEMMMGQNLMHDVLELLSIPKDFRIEVSSFFAQIQVPRMPMQQILLNLINNAIKHHDKPKGFINVNVEDQGECYKFSVRDDGPGIAPQYHEQVFKMFQTLRPRDQVEGSGMGLAMVRKHIDTYGGVLTLKSEEGKGCEFSFTWPKKAV